MAKPKAPLTVALRDEEADMAALMEAISPELNVYPAPAPAPTPALAPAALVIPKDIQAITVPRISESSVQDELDSHAERADAAEASKDATSLPAAHSLRDARMPASRAAPADPEQKEEREAWAPPIR